MQSLWTKVDYEKDKTRNKQAMLDENRILIATMKIMPSQLWQNIPILTMTGGKMFLLHPALLMKMSVP